MKIGTMIVILVDDHRQGNFNNLIDITTGGLFGLMKLTTNSLDANLYAVTSLTKGNTSLAKRKPLMMQLEYCKVIFN